MISLLAEVSTQDWRQFWTQWGINLAVALVTLGTVLVAIWGNWFRSLLAAPIITIEPHDLTGYEAQNEAGQTLVFFFLKVRNSRRWSPAKGVRVLLTRLERRGPDGRFHEVTTSIPFQFGWTPFESSQVVQTITDERIFDFGCLKEAEFWPQWYSHPIGKDYFLVRAGDAVRYHLRAVGENFHCKNSTVVEVAWDGVYTLDLSKLGKHLRITLMAKSAA